MRWKTIGEWTGDVLRKTVCSPDRNGRQFMVGIIIQRHLFSWCMSSDRLVIKFKRLISTELLHMNVRYLEEPEVTQIHLNQC